MSRLASRVLQRPNARETSSMISILDRLRAPQLHAAGSSPPRASTRSPLRPLESKHQGETQDYPAKSRLHSAKHTSNKDETPYRKPQEKLSTVPTVSQIPTQAPHCSTTYPHTGEHAP
ncbi:hypothetical protein CPAR01_08187 [Colletotrichum paranaense]|uniref:Uncharacterized protein n=1 Tax=Colletotrichum paranaense TaxID=1914294 RepID=A0ABQ9SJL8_9PEZI|nr:uncharacterized protein CPAR01_08187 [Colletotrichum paranaense]KAK1538074.1 hypothetical protein CPAR01_08187 [Colletotrichum paranaense]